MARPEPHAIVQPSVHFYTAAMLGIADVVVFCSIGQFGLEPAVRRKIDECLQTAFLFRNGWTSWRYGAVVFAPIRSPGIAGLHSVQGEGLAFARRVENDHVQQTQTGSKNSCN